MNIKNVFNLIVFLVVFYTVTAIDAYAESNEVSKPSITLDADELIFIAEENKILAQGNVSAVSDLGQLYADEISYEKESGYIKAFGQVCFIDSYGNVYNAREVNIAEDLDSGDIYDFKVKMSSRGILESSYAKLLGNNSFKAENVSYTICEICDKKGVEKSKPIWSIGASKVTHDGDKQRIIFRNAVLRTHGVPIFYIPYLNISTPEVKRKTGFLYPIFRWSDDFGANIKLPFYVNIKPNMDLVITPWLLHNLKDQVSINYRHLTHVGQYEVIASITEDERSGTRSHLEAEGEFKVLSLGKNAVIGFDIIRSHDRLDTYLKRYDINDLDVLSSKLYYENYNNHGFLDIKLLQFQGLRDIDNFKITPQAYPLIELENKVLLRDNLKLFMKANFLNLYRAQGVNLRRIIGDANLNFFRIKYGQRFESNLQLRADVYDVNIRQGPALDDYLELRDIELDVDEGIHNRIFAKFSNSWSAPFLYRNQQSQYDLILEPKIKLVLADRLSHNRKFVNEDSQSPEISIDELFSNNLYKGYDLYYDGSSLTYSLNSVLSKNQWRLGLELGQIYNLDHTNDFPSESGLHRNFSDLVSRFEISYRDLINLQNRLRVSNDSFSVINNEIFAQFNWQKLHADLEYYGLGSSITRNSNLDFRKELDVKLRYSLNKRWETQYNIRTKLGMRNMDGQKLIAQGFKVLYKGSCLELEAGVMKDYTTLNDLKPRVNYQFKINVPNA